MAKTSIEITTTHVPAYFSDAPVESRKNYQTEIADEMVAKAKAKIAELGALVEQQALQITDLEKRLDDLKHKVEKIFSGEIYQ